MECVYVFVFADCVFVCTANRFIIDVLNDSIIELPEQGWEMLEQHLNYAGMHS